MLDSVIVAREKFLRPGGIVAPSQCSIVLAAIQDEALYNDRVTYWQQVYGMSICVPDISKPWLTRAACDQASK